MPTGRSAGRGFLEQRRQPAHDRRKHQQDGNVRQNVSLPAFPIHAISDQNNADQQDNRQEPARAEDGNAPERIRVRNVD